MKLKLLVTTLFGYLISVVVASKDDEPIIETPLGKVRGYTMTSRTGRRFYAFSGLPYAQPPINDLRFEPPQPALPWRGIKDAKEHGPFCLQANLYLLNPRVIGVEDCLYLSLYTHNISRKAPVIVHFHGGGFVSGNGARKTKPQYFMDEDVVIVDVNYRVGIMGFLSFEDEVMPGNQALKDQVQALKWVQQNIASFGGDPNCVTIIGESAGSRSVYHHTISPLSKGLFHRAIAESGTSYNFGSLLPRGYVSKQSHRLAELTNCTRSNTKEIVACFKAKNARELADQLIKYREWQIDPIFIFGVVFETGPGAFLTGPKKSWKHADVPCLMGTTSAEGLLRTAYFLRYNMSWEWYTENFNNVAPISLGYSETASDPTSITKKLREYYLPKKEITLEDWPKIVQMYTDSLYKMGIMEGADKHAGEVYFYYFDYLGIYTLGGNLNRTLMTGAFHTDEIIYIWYNELFANINGPDLMLSKKLVKLWTNFAKYGTPTPKGSEIKWDTWTPNHHRYLHISNDGIKMAEGLAEDRYRFWKTLNTVDKLEK